MNTTLATAVLVFHALFALFIVGGFFAIWVGAALGWDWVRAPGFRRIHLALIGIVALLAALDIPCPLTVLEDWLSTGSVGRQGFIARWVGRALFYDFPAWAFTLAYVLFALAVLLTWRYVPPRPRRHR